MADPHKISLKISPAVSIHGESLEAEKRARDSGTRQCGNLCCLCDSIVVLCILSYADFSKSQVKPYTSGLEQKPKADNQDGHNLRPLKLA